MDKIFFIGRFPPPYGGATVKCEVLYEALSKHINVEKFDTESKNKNKAIFFIRLLKFIFKNKNEKGIICVASISLFKLTRYINFIDSNMLGNMSVFAIGGAIDELIVHNNIDISIMNKYKVIYVECHGTKENLENLGLKNIKVIPNCRRKPSSREYHENLNEVVKGLFISRIDEKKGIFNITEAFRQLPKEEFEVDFYGPIDDEIKEKFNKEVEEIENVNYKGIIESDKVDIYPIISKYDVLLFPTFYGEGYPGIITECKIAGIPIISSNFKYSKEIIKHNVDGIIMKENTAQELREVLISLREHNDSLIRLRRNAYISGEECFIETYIGEIINDITS